MKTVEAMRSEFRKLASACGMSAKAFSKACRSLAHELADGEEVEPKHWVSAARETVYVKTGKVV